MSLNEILYASIGNELVAQTLDAEYLLLLADRRSLPNHPALLYRGSVNGRGSNVIKVPHLGLQGYDVAGQQAENGSTPNTAVTDSSSLITVTKWGMARSASDLARIVRGDIFNPAIMAQDALQCVSNRMVQLVADVVDGFTATGGTSGADLDTADVLAAFGTAEVNNMVGPFMGMIHGQQWSDLINDIGVSVGGSAQYLAANEQMMTLRGQAYKGTFLGVDMFVLNRVNSNGTDRLGAIFGPGAVLWADGTPPVDDPDEQMLIGRGGNGGSPMPAALFERERVHRAQETGWITSCYLGVSMGIQNGLTLGSDA